MGYAQSPDRLSTPILHHPIVPHIPSTWHITVMIAVATMMLLVGSGLAGGLL